MKRFDIITVGGATEDMLLTVDDYCLIDNPSDPLRQKLIAFEYGAKIGVSKIKTSFGGGAANTAVAFSRLGFKTATISAVGDDDRGERLVKNLARHRIDTRFIKTEHNLTSGLSFILEAKNHEHTLFTYRGANDCLALNAPDLRALKKARRIYLTSLSGNWRSVLTVIMSSNRSIAWNPGRMQLAAGFKTLKPFLEKIDVLILNKDEAIELTGRAGPINQLVRRLVSFGPRIAVVTDGAHGAIAFDGEKNHRVLATKTKIIDTTGVGDAFGATFVAALDRDYSVNQALRYAAKNAASVIAKSGAQIGLKTANELGL